MLCCSSYLLFKLANGNNRFRQIDTSCCESSTSCCKDLKSDITMVQRKLNACCAAQAVCCTTLESGIASIESKLNECCSASNDCCNMLIMEIAQLLNNLDTCCAAQAACCEQIKQTLTTIIDIVTACCSSGGGYSSCCGMCCFISSIPAGGLVLDTPCHYIVTNDLFYDGGASAGVAINQTIRSPQLLAQTCPPPPTPVNFGIVIASSGVQLDFNNYTLTIAGENIAGCRRRKCLLTIVCECGVYRW